MNAFRLIAAALLVTTMMTGALADDAKDKPDHAKLIIGKWEVTKSNKELPPGSTMEFAKEGAMKITGKRDGKERSIDAVYKVEGDQLQFTLKLADKEEKKLPLAIKKLTQDELVLGSEKGIDFEFKRVK